MSKPDPPQPPNPVATAAAQTGTNVSTAVANSMLNNMNQYTPDGSLRYDVTGNFDWTDPSTGQKYSIPRQTVTQSLSPQSQAIKAQQDAAKMNMAGMANSQSARIAGVLGTAFNPDFNAQNYLAQNPDVAENARQRGIDPAQAAREHYDLWGRNEGRSGGMAPAGGNAKGILGAPQAQTSFDKGWDITKSYGPQDDFSSDRQRVEDALMSRMNPQLARERGNIEQRLADQGIRYGSAAYTGAMDDYNRQATDTRFGAISQAGQEQQRMMDMAAQRGAFENQAQSQNFQQNAALGAFYNSGAAQQLAQQQAGFNAQNASRNQFMQEQYAQRNQPINEITSLMSGSQVQNPQWANVQNQQIPTTDFAGITNQNFQNQMGVYNAQNQNWQTLMGGLAGLGAAGIKASDERVKKNISKIGNVFAYNEDAEREGLPIYEYEYKHGDGARHVGPMAQDVEQIDRGAVRSIGGVKHIDTRRVMGNILRAA